MTTTKQQGARHRELVAKRSRDISVGVREIAPLPSIINPQRRMKARKDFRYFCEQYFPKKFQLAWSVYHLQVIARLQQIFLDGGGKLALAMPRGSGKTTLAETAVVWALVFGHCRYVIIVGANDKEAKKIIKSIKASLIGSEPLLADYPESVYPFRCLDGQALRARGQLYLGDLTEIEWKPDSITFAKIPGSPASGATVVTVGIRGAIRGKNKFMPDGSVARPDAVVLDDPQTDADARSPNQVAKLESIINGTIEGLVGPGEELAMIMPCTVIQEGDLADRYLNRNIYSRWRGLRFKMLETMPERMDLWEQYKEIRKTDETAAKMFYKRNRTEMKKGALAAWEANYSESCLDALQFAMNKWADNYESFMAEYQNEPLRAQAGASLTEAKIIRSRLNGLEQGTLPPEATTLTAFIDVHDDLLYYTVAAWADDFTGYIIDYGTEPKQSRRYFAKGDTGLNTLNRYGNERKDGAIQAGLVTLIKNLLSADYGVQGDTDGTERPAFSKILIDGGYKPEIVENAIRLACGRTNQVMPSKGKGIRSSQLPMAQWKHKPGERFGEHWLETKPERRMRCYTIDTNFWKCQVHDAFSLQAGNRGGVTLWGRESETHQMFSEHLNGETPKLSKTGENEVNEWFGIPNRDNHFFDCMVGAMAAASICGIKTAEAQLAKAVKRKRTIS